MKTNKQKNAFVILAIIALAILVVGWFYFSSQPTTLSIVTDQEDYFIIDEPVIKVELQNPKSANSGEIVVNYTDDLLDVKSQEVAEGVTMREVANKLVFELSDVYFKSGSSTVATVQFEASDRGTMTFEFDQSATQLNKDGQTLTIDTFNDAEFGLGVIPSRDNQQIIENNLPVI